MDLQGIPFTKVYRSMLTSSIWTTPRPHLHMVRCVWMTLMMLADKRGFVHSSVPGLAAAALVSIEEAEQALEVFREPDPYSRTQEHEGRKLLDVDGGWFLLNYEKHRGTGESERAKESKRNWYHRNKHPKTREEHPTRTLLSASVSSDPDQSLAGPEAPPSEPVSDAPTSSQRVVFRNLDGWVPSEALIAEALIGVLTRAEFDERVAELRNGPIGGARGVFSRDDYVRKQLGRWRTWAEEARSKAVHRPGSTNGGAYGSRVPPVLNARQTGWGLQLDGAHAAFAEQHGLDAAALVSEFLRSGHADALSTHQEADQAFAKFLKRAARGRKRAGP